MKKLSQNLVMESCCGAIILTTIMSDMTIH
jgi:hypothetical protein